MTREKTKKPSSSGRYTFDIGSHRREKILRFRAMQTLKGTQLRSMEEAVNVLLDKALEAEQV